MVAILTTKKTKPIVLNHVIISSYAALVWRNFAADSFTKKYDNQSQSKGNRIQSNTIERQSNAIEHNRILSNFPKFSIFDWHSINLINRISIVRLRSIDSIIEIFD